MSGDQPVLPYEDQNHPTSGWAGSETSRERAVRDDTSGTTSARQRAVLRMLAAYGETGVTYFELGTRTGLHHGQSSGVLSNLHKVGAIDRLVERRHNCHVYVLPEFVAGRETQPMGRVARPGLGPVADEMFRLLREAKFADEQLESARMRALVQYQRIVRQ